MASAVAMSGGHLELFENAQAWDFFGWFIPFMVLFIALEALYSHANDLKLYSFNDTFVSMSHGIFTGLIFQRLIIPALDLSIQCWIYYHYAIFRVKATWWIHLLTFFAVDCTYYWMHRAEHEINILWATHQVHHSSEYYNLSTATRQGVLQQLFDWFFYLPLTFVVPPSALLIHRQFNTLYQFGVHTQLVGKLPRFVEFVFNTPSHHRVHHARNAKYLDKNFAGVLIIWDRLFGTFKEEEEPAAYGLLQPDTFYDLFRAQFGHYLHIVQRYLSYDSIIDRLSVLFCGPGWIPGSARLGGPVVDDHSVRTMTGLPSYNPPLHPQLNNYLTFHTIALFSLVLIITPAIDEKSTLDYALSAYAVVGMYQLSRIFQYGWGAFLPIELTRIAVYLFVDIGCLLHNWYINGRTHGLWWSPGISYFSYADHTLLAFIFLIHVYSLVFIKMHWNEIWDASIVHLGEKISAARRRRNGSGTNVLNRAEAGASAMAGAPPLLPLDTIRRGTTPRVSPRELTRKPSSSPRTPTGENPKSPRGCRVKKT